MINHLQNTTWRRSGKGCSVKNTIKTTAIYAEANGTIYRMMLELNTNVNGLTVIYTKKDTKYCSFPRFKHIDTRSHLRLVIFQRKPFSNSLKHGDFFQLFVVPCVCPLTVDVVYEHVIGQRLIAKTKTQRKSWKNMFYRSYNGGIFSRRKRAETLD